MLGEAQDVLLAAETSLARHRDRCRNNKRTTVEAPHCVTCYCVDKLPVNRQRRCSSSRRHSTRRSNAVDELLREMSFNTTILSDEETYVNGKNEVADESSASVPLASPSRCVHGSSYCEDSKSPETTVRSCKQWLEHDNSSQIRTAKSSNVERNDVGHSDGSKRKWSSDRKNSSRLQQQQQRLLGGGDRNVQTTKEPTKATNVDEEVSSTSETLAEEAHVRELKLVRWQFIERIHDEVGKLHRLQRHLDGCCSPPPPLLTDLAPRRSVATMTNAKLCGTDSNVSQQL